MDPITENVDENKSTDTFLPKKGITQMKSYVLVDQLKSHGEKICTVSHL